MARPRAAWADAVLAALVALTVGMMIVPLPTPLLDLLIAANVSLGVLFLAVSLYVRDGLSFASFPTLLLITTLYRLALNVSSTRLILLQADAGEVIDAFGRFVVRGDYAVGAAIFLIFTLIQWVVIAKGSERVAEVGARFTLDAMPGKQLAIDAEQRSGGLSQQGGRDARRALERESQFYGAMDGAMKFVKGDAVAGLVITLINIAAGVGIGIGSRGLSLAESLRTYGLLTIGDGLVTMIPALLISTSAGLVVTRVASPWRDGSLGQDVAAQLFGDPRPLGAAAALLLALALVPGLPWWPFLTAAVGGAALAYRAWQNQHDPAVQLERDGDTESAQGICVAAAPALARELSASPGWRQTLVAVAQRLEEDLGLGLPPVRIAADASLEPGTYRVHWRELPAPVRTVEGEARSEVGASVSQSVERHAHDLLDLDTVEDMLSKLEQRAPALVRHTVPTPVSLPALAEVLRALAREGVSIRWLDEILSALASAPNHDDTDEVVEFVRTRLARRITQRVAPAGKLRVLQLDPDVQDAVRDGVVRDGSAELLALPPDLARDIQQAAAETAREHTPDALLAPAALRRHVRQLIEDELPQLPVLCPAELSRDLQVETVGTVAP